jgi:hypothetical protein
VEGGTGTVGGAAAVVGTVTGTVVETGAAVESLVVLELLPHAARAAGTCQVVVAGFLLGCLD